MPTHKLISFVGALACLLVLAGCSRPETKALGGARWSTQNLNVSNFRNGDPIPEAKSAAEWSRATEKGTPAWCFYENESASGAKFGRLYNWIAVNDLRGLAPVGWRMPSQKDWKQAEENFGKGDDLFSWQRGGYRHRKGNFRMVGQVGYWWTATQTGPKVTAYSRQTVTGSEMPKEENSGLGSGFSVRLVKD